MFSVDDKIMRKTSGVMGQLDEEEAMEITGGTASEGRGQAGPTEGFTDGRISGLLLT